MHKNWIAVNILLCMVAGLLGWQLVVAVRQFDAQNDPTNILPVQDVKQRIGGEGEIPPLQPPRPYDPNEFAVIPAQDLFSQSRGIDEEEEAAVVTEAPQLKVKPVLVGVTLSGRDRLAIINDPSASRGGRGTKIMRLGDTFEGYTVTDIAANRMVLEFGGQREVIPLYDPAKHAQGQGKTPIIATRVISFGAGGAAAGSAQGQRGAPSAVVRGQPAVRTGVSTNVRGRQSAGDSVRQSVVTTQAQEEAPEGSEQPARPANELIDAQGRRIIRTPFGDIVRPAPKKP